MLFSFACPQCKHVLLAEENQIGKMTLCGHCLVSFPIPDNISSLPASASSKRTPRPTPESDDGDTILPQRGSEPGWGLLRLGLTLLQISLIVFMAAGFIGYIGILFSGSRALSNPFRADNPPVVIIAAFIALTALGTGFIGMCLCCTAPAESGSRFLIRAAVVLLLVASVAGTGAFVLTGLSLLVPGFRDVLIGVAVCAGAAFVMFWLFFLKGIADHFRNHELAQNAGTLLVLAFFLSTLNLCVVAASSFSSSLVLLLPLVIPCILYGWHLRLVIRIRHTIPLRNQHRP